MEEQTKTEEEWCVGEKKVGGFHRFIDRLEHHWIEIAAAALMALATIFSAYCAYQSSIWHGEEFKHYSQSSKDLTAAFRLAEQADLERDVDVQVLFNYENALHGGNQELADLYRSRGFSPALEKAMSAWEDTLAAGESVPRNPFLMPEYELEVEEKSEVMLEQATSESNKAENATHNSNNYILLTVLFASVLFFAGIAAKFQLKIINIGLLGFGLVIFMTAIVILLMQP